MKVKYKQQIFDFPEDLTLQQLRTAVAMRWTQLSNKNWVFCYMDVEGDQVLLQNGEDFRDTMQFYASCQKSILLTVKEQWWKTKKIQSRARIRQEYMSRKSETNKDSARSSSSYSCNSSDDQYLRDVRPGEYFYEDEQKPKEGEGNENDKEEEEIVEGMRSISLRDGKQKKSPSRQQKKRQGQNRLKSSSSQPMSD